MQATGGRRFQPMISARAEEVKEGMEQFLRECYERERSLVDPGYDGSEYWSGRGRRKNIWKAILDKLSSYGITSRYRISSFVSYVMNNSRTYYPTVLLNDRMIQQYIRYEQDKINLDREKLIVELRSAREMIRSGSKISLISAARSGVPCKTALARCILAWKAGDHDLRKELEAELIQDMVSRPELYSPLEDAIKELLETEDVAQV